MSKQQKDKQKDAKPPKEKINELITSYFKEYESYSRELSLICRQLAFAEGALFWFSKHNLNASDFLIIMGFGLLIFYFIFDALQYFIGMRKSESLSYTFLRDFEKHKIYDESNYELPQNHHLIINIFFNLKLIMISLSSFFLIYALSNGLFHHINCNEENNYKTPSLNLIIH